jgi:hypothetical protein
MTKKNGSPDQVGDDRRNCRGITENKGMTEEMDPPVKPGDDRGFAGG